MSAALSHTQGGLIMKIWSELKNSPYGLILLFRLVVFIVFLLVAGVILFR